MDYWSWRECISEAFDDADIKVSEEQRDTVIACVEDAHENYGLTTGQDCISNPPEQEIKNMGQKNYDEVEKIEERHRIQIGEMEALRRSLSPGDRRTSKEIIQDVPTAMRCK